MSSERKLSSQTFALLLGSIFGETSRRSNFLQQGLAETEGMLHPVWQHMEFYRGGTLVKQPSGLDSQLTPSPDVMHFFFQTAQDWNIHPLEHPLLLCRWNIISSICQIHSLRAIANVYSCFHSLSGQCPEASRNFLAFYYPGFSSLGFLLGFFHCPNKQFLL